MNDIFFICTHGKEELKKFMEKFNNFTPNLRFTYESSEKGISFLDFIITASKQKLKTTLHIKSTDRQSTDLQVSTYIMPPQTQNILSAQLFSAKH